VRTPGRCAIAHPLALQPLDAAADVGGKSAAFTSIRKLQRALMTTVFDAAGNGSGELVGRSCAQAEADGYEPAALAGRALPLQASYAPKSKKRTRNGFNHRNTPVLLRIAEDSLTTFVL
jgi:hypothetical protein